MKQKLSTAVQAVLLSLGLMSGIASANTQNSLNHPNSAPSHLTGHVSGFNHSATGIQHQSTSGTEYTYSGQTAKSTSSDGQTTWTHEGSITNEQTSHTTTRGSSSNPNSITIASSTNTQPTAEQITRNIVNAKAATASSGNTQ